MHTPPLSSLHSLQLWAVSREEEGAPFRGGPTSLGAVPRPPVPYAVARRDSGGVGDCGRSGGPHAASHSSPLGPAHRTSAAGPPPPVLLELSYGEPCADSAGSNLVLRQSHPLFPVHDPRRRAPPAAGAACTSKVPPRGRAAGRGEGSEAAVEGREEEEAEKEADEEEGQADVSPLWNVFQQTLGEKVCVWVGGRGGVSIRVSRSVPEAFAAPKPLPLPLPHAPPPRPPPSGPPPAGAPACPPHRDRHLPL